MKSFYLAGDTGCALHMDHRRSHDFDFFSRSEFEIFPIQNALRNLGRFVADYSDAGTLVGRLDDTKISLFHRNLGLDLKTFFGYFERKYGPDGFTRHHVLKSLVYFEDADKEPEPVMLADYSWDATKRFFVESVGAFGPV